MRNLPEIASPDEACQSGRVGSRGEPPVRPAGFQGPPVRRRPVRWDSTMWAFRSSARSPRRPRRCRWHMLAEALEAQQAGLQSLFEALPVEVGFRAAARRRHA